MRKKLTTLCVANFLEAACAGDAQRPSNRCALPCLTSTARRLRALLRRAVDRPPRHYRVRAAVTVRVRSAARGGAPVRLVGNSVTVGVGIAGIALPVAVHVRLVRVRQAEAVVERVECPVTIVVVVVEPLDG